MATEKIQDLKPSMFKVNPSLDRFENVPMFEEKLAGTKEFIRTHGLPKMDENGRLLPIPKNNGVKIKKIKSKLVSKQQTHSDTEIVNGIETPIPKLNPELNA